MKEIFNIPVGDAVGLDNGEVRLLYSPLADGLLLVSYSDAQLIEDCLRNGPEGFAPEIVEASNELRHNTDLEAAFAVLDINQTTKLSVIPNNRCNFGCSYCYSAAGRNGHEVPWTTLKRTLDWFIDARRFDDQKAMALSIFISGGGEPLLSWDSVTRRMLEYSRERAAEQGLPLRLMIISNGSLLTTEIAHRLAELEVSVGVSFEVLPDLQNRQRGHYDDVVRGLETLHNAGVATLMNSTITPESVGRMEEMYAEVGRHWPFVRRYTMEPVTGSALFASAAELRSFYDAFFDGYLRCKERQNDVELRFTFDDDYRELCVRHCPGKLSLTPEGTFSVCHLVSSPKEERYADCVYGTADDSGIHLDTVHFAQLYSRNVASYTECADCFAKWVCGGECLTRRSTYTAEQMAEVCRFNRRYVRHQLLSRVEEEVKEAYGTNLYDYVRQ